MKKVTQAGSFSSLLQGAATTLVYIMLAATAFIGPVHSVHTTCAVHGISASIPVDFTAMITATMVTLCGPFVHNFKY